MEHVDVSGFYRRDCNHVAISPKDHQGQSENQHRPNGQCEPEKSPAMTTKASAAANMMSHARPSGDDGRDDR